MWKAGGCNKLISFYRLIIKVEKKYLNKLIINVKKNYLISFI